MITIIVIINLVITFTCDGNVVKIVMKSLKYFILQD